MFQITENQLIFLFSSLALYPMLNYTETKIAAISVQFCTKRGRRLLYYNGRAGGGGRFH